MDGIDHPTDLYAPGLDILADFPGNGIPKRSSFIQSAVLFTEKLDHHNQNRVTNDEEDSSEGEMTSAVRRSSISDIRGVWFECTRERQGIEQKGTLLNCS